MQLLTLLCYGRLCIIIADVRVHLTQTLVGAIRERLRIATASICVRCTRASAYKYCGRLHINSANVHDYNTRSIGAY